jgi:ubiquinone/menaquinone biosynthesis C-methylase UbiE
VKPKQQRFLPGVIDYNGVIAENYRAGRALSSETAETWRRAIERFVETAPPLIILDLGAGTGRFSGLFAESFQAQVIAIEPSRSMLAAGGQRSPRVAYAAGIAECLPLRDQVCDVAWLSQVFHHIRDRRACARELRRVIRPGGRVLIRGTFGDKLDGFPTLFRFFPRTRLICESFPTTKEATVIFEGEKFVLEAARRIEQRTCGSLREFAKRTCLRADTALALIPDEEFAQGLAVLQETGARERNPTPVMETLDLLVFKAVT